MKSEGLAMTAGITGAPKPPVASGGWPLLGHIKPVLTTPNSFFIDNYHQHGPVFRVKFAGKPVNILCGTEANRWCSRHEKDFLQSEGIWNGLGLVYGADPQAVIVNNDGAHHKVLRSQLKDSISRGAFEEKADIAASELAHALKRLNTGAPLNVVALCKRVVYQQLGEMLVEDAPWERLDDYSRLVDAFVLSVTLPVSAYMPKFGKSRRSIRAVREHSANLVKRHLHNNYLDMKSGNFIELLIQGAQKGLYPEKDLPFLSVGAIVAGIDTLAHSMAFAIYAIASDPALKAVVMSETDKVMDSDLPLMEKLKKLDETRAAVMESMRLYPISPGQRRIIRNDVELNGYQLRKGEDVIVAHAAAHFQDDIYDQPQVFDRTRFYSGNTAWKQPGAFAPFGVGPHICLGAGMAEIQLLFNVAEIFHRYEVTADKNYALRIQWIPSGKPKGK